MFEHGDIVKYKDGLFPDDHYEYNLYLVYDNNKINMNYSGIPIQFINQHSSSYELMTSIFRPDND